MFNLIRNLTKLGRKTKMVFVVRTDLKMSAGKVAAQCAHASITLYDSALKVNDVCVKQWMDAGQPKIVLKIDQDCENELKKLYCNAEGLGLNVCLIRDAGRTQISPGSVTVLGIGPNLVEDIDKITLKLKLL